MKGKGRGHPNGHIGAYKKRSRQERALRLLLEQRRRHPQFSNPACYDAWLAASKTSEAGLRRVLGADA